MVINTQSDLGEKMQRRRALFLYLKVSWSVVAEMVGVIINTVGLQREKPNGQRGKPNA